MSKKRKKASAEQLNYRPVCILGVLTVVACIVMVAVLSLSGGASVGKFVPPPFESTAVQGIPEVPQELAYSSPYQEGMAYRFSVCAYVTTDENNAVVYFTNAEDNDVYLKLRILDDSGSILGETGLLKPGEYVKDVVLSNVLSPGTEIHLKVMSYEPDTYMSAGSVVLNVSVGANN